MLISIFHAGHDKRPRVKRRYGSLDRPYEQELVRRCASAGAPPPVRLHRCAFAGAPPPVRLRRCASTVAGAPPSLPVRLLCCRCVSSAAGAPPPAPSHQMFFISIQFNSLRRRCAPSVAGSPLRRTSPPPPLSSVCPSVDSSALESLQKIDHNRRVNLK